MTLQPPNPNVELPLGREPSLEDIRDLAKKLQQFQDFICQQFPVSGGNLGASAEKVTSLPTQGLFVGKQVVFKAAEGVYWNLLYTKESVTYPWNKIGGPPLRKRESAEPAISTSLKTEGAPSITLPAVAMEFDAEYGATLAFSTGTLTNGCMIPFVNEVEQTDNLRTYESSGGHPVHHKTFNLTATSGQVVRIKYIAEAFTGAASFRQMYLTVDPVRVG